MNALMGYDFASPLNPEVCWRISVALFHTTWQICVLWILVYVFLKQKRVSLHRRFQVSMACLMLAGCLPLLNYFVSVEATLPIAVSAATDEFDLSGSVSLFRPSELVGEPQTELAHLSSVAAKPVVSEAATLSDEASGYWTVSTSTIVTIMYLLGVAVMLLRLGQAIGSQRRLKVSIGKTVSESRYPRLFRAAKAAASTFNRKLQTRVATFEGKDVAFVFGVLQPVILVNASLLSGMTPQQLQHIFVHELAHVYRFDPLTQFAQRFIESILFFHPGVWWISGEVSRLRELCCDDVAARRFNSAEYADTLLQCYALQMSQPRANEKAPKASAGSNLALPMAAAQSSQLASRIEVLLDEENAPIRSTRRPGSVSLVMRFVLLALFMLAAFTILSSRSPAESLASQQEPELQTASEFAWNSIKDIGDSVVDAPHLWFTGMRLSLQSSVPDDVSVNAMVDLNSCQFAQWHFGDSRSTRVALLIEKEGTQINRVYLDKNRDRIIEWDEELSTSIHDGKVWIANVKTMAGSADDLVSGDRQVAIYPRKDRVRIRTLGFATGEVDVADETKAIRRIDIDGDGIPVGNRDQVWIDLDSDTVFDPISERFNMADQLTIAGQPYIVRSDSLGHTLTLTPQGDVGYMKFSFELSDRKAKLEMLEGSLRDENGMLIAVRLSGEPISIPPGRYCLEELVVRAMDSEDTTWEINLSRGMGGGWIEVESGKTVDVSLLKDLQFTGTAIHDDDSHSGYLSHLQPSIYTSNGLVINELTRLEKGQKNDDWSLDRLVSIQASRSSVPERQACSGFN